MVNQHQTAIWEMVFKKYIQASNMQIQDWRSTDFSLNHNGRKGSWFPEDVEKVDDWRRQFWEDVDSRMDFERQIIDL